MSFSKECARKSGRTVAVDILPPYMVTFPCLCLFSRLALRESKSQSVIGGTFYEAPGE